jgi:glucose dehydrogenase
VKKLAAAWVFQTGVSDGGLQATPIVVDGVMYLSTSRNHRSH